MPNGIKKFLQATSHTDRLLLQYTSLYGKYSLAEYLVTSVGLSRQNATHYIRLQVRESAVTLPLSHQRGKNNRGIAAHILNFDISCREPSTSCTDRSNCGKETRYCLTIH